MVKTKTVNKLTSNEILVQFMWTKKRIFDDIIKQTGFKWPKDIKKYFIKKDEKYLLSLSKQKADDVLKKLKNYIFKEDYTGIRPETCPFCILFQPHVYNMNDTYCMECEYGKNHDICNDFCNNNTLDVCGDIIKQDYNKYLEYFSNDRYREILNSIEEVQNNEKS